MTVSERRYEAIVRAAELARQSRAEASQERYERFLQLRRGGYSIKEAAWELEISPRQAARYVARSQRKCGMAQPQDIRPTDPGPVPESVDHGAKRCALCEVVKPVAEFNRDSTRSDGLRYACKPCNAEALEARRVRRGAA